MKRSAALAELMRGVGEDVRDYRLLATLLEQQFEAALTHQAAHLADLAERISGMTATLDRRRVQRVALVTALAGKGASIDSAFALLTEPPREALRGAWATLEALVRECKQRNERNCRLMMDQYSIMQRVLHGDEATYVPA
jgi:flagella synthesis protein FlgN